jgi:hypothetical protein
VHFVIHLARQHVRFLGKTRATFCCLRGLELGQFAGFKNKRILKEGTAVLDTSSHTKTADSGKSNEAPQEVPAQAGQPYGLRIMSLIFSVPQNVARNPVARAIERKRCSDWLKVTTHTIYEARTGEHCPSPSRQFRDGMTRKTLEASLSRLSTLALIWCATIRRGTKLMRTRLQTP